MCAQTGQLPGELAGRVDALIKELRRRDRKPVLSEGAYLQLGELLRAHYTALSSM